MDLARILPLPQHVVDRIAAGEVIQRPYSAVKELIENSVDAGSTQITVTVKGVSSMLQVQDNGHGIHPEDLNVVCKRFNTSKLRQFDDLKAMKTYGFRGEALASMTHVARVTITSQKPGQPCAYRATYKDGSVVSKPSKCAGVVGTTITVEDLFYNVPQRLNALKGATEEYNKILDVVQKYAVHHSGKIGFTVKRAGVHSPDLHTSAGASLTENISKIYGSDVGRELLELRCESQNNIFSSMQGIITNPNFHRKKGEFLLFINGRLVDSIALKRIIDQVYAECLPKGGHPFVYLSLELPLENVDVNVHPTKKEVQFLHEEEITEALHGALKQLLLSGNESRAFEVATVRRASLEEVSSQPTKRVRADEQDEEENEEEQKESTPGPTQTNLKKSIRRSDNKMVRTDSQLGAGIERFVFSTPRASSKPSAAGYVLTEENLDTAPLIVSTSDALQLESVKELQKEVDNRRNVTITDSLKRSVFVGVIDETFSLVQIDTSLVAIDHLKFAQELFYQRSLSLFGRFKKMTLDPAPSVLEILDGNKEEYDLVMSRSDLLYEYFHIDMRNDGLLKCIPRLLVDFVPQPICVVRLVRGLARNVDWNSEMTCFRTIARQLAVAYTEMPSFNPLVLTTPGSTLQAQFGDKTSLQYIIKNVLLPAIKSFFVAPLDFSDTRNRCVVPLAKLEQLYKIFERC